MPPAIVQIVRDERFRHHRGPEGHPERPERLIAIDEAILPFRDRLEFTEPRPADDDEILRVHDRALIDFLASTRGQPPGKIDPDTYYCAESHDVARLAAGGCVDLVLRILRGEVGSGFAAIRPPGHHAEADRAMGFCLLNNVAIATRAIQAVEPDARILILDWDVHHGNGTQHVFESDPSVLYLSTHQFPFYPGTGDFDEVGRAEGVGRTINIPMPAGCGNPEYVGLLQRVVVPAARWFAPDIILISCGFDAHRDDPLASMELDRSGYLAMTQIMRSLADASCRGRLAVILEGGYALSGLREGTTAVLEGLTDPSRPSAPVPTSDLVRGSVLAELVDRVGRIHGQRIPDLGAT